MVTVEDGVATKLRGNPDHPYSRGELCPKVNRFLDRVYSPDRLLYPLRRVGAKGDGRFERISWDAALAEIAREWRSRVDRFGGETLLPFWSAGTQGHVQADSLSARLFTLLGASRQGGSLCGATAGAGVAATLGTGKTIDSDSIRHSRFIVLWGTNTRITNRHLWPIIEEARSAGATVVVIDPVRTITAEAADWFVQPLPGTDAALALAMMHVIIRDGLVDQPWVDAYTDGFVDLAERAAQWPPTRAGEVCGLEAAEIERLAVAYAATRPSVIRMLVGAEHHEHGAMLFRTVACLPALVGAWRDLGGGLCRSNGTYMGEALNEFAIPAPDGKFGRSLNQSALALSLTAVTDPPITALMVWNSNPLVVVPDAERTRRGLARDDLFTVVHEQFLTDTASYADIVLPATTQIEQLDIVPAWGHMHIGFNSPAIAPMGECVSNTELFRRLAGALGLTDPRLFEDDETLVRHALASGNEMMKGITFESLRDAAVQRLNIPLDYRPYAEGGFATKTGKVALRSSMAAALGQDPLPNYEPARESPSGDSDLAGRFPLVLLTTKSHTRFLNSSYSQLPKHGPLEGAPHLEMDEADAAARGLLDGQSVRVLNDRAVVLVPLRISKRLRPGVVSLPFGWWQHQHEGGRTANALTNAAMVDWGGGVAFHDTLVEVRAAPA